jgi:nifR3 family TIM-barrel protein
MVTGFWKKLKKPIFALAPMANVTDAAFRRIIAEHGKPDVFWTEFVSCDGLCSGGKERLLVDFWFSKKERPIVAQIFGSRPENFYKTAQLVVELGFDGIDINMGCPDRGVERQGAGAALIKNPKLAQEIIAQTKRGAKDAGKELPVSVKTRIGYSENTLSQWLPYLLDTGLAAVTIHARTRKEMSLVPAHWDVVADAVRMRDAHDSSRDRTLIIGNGDARDIADAREKAKQSGADGVMLGTAIFGNPWLFSRRRKALSVEEKLAAMVEHTKLFEKLFTGIKRFEVMKKHYKAYANGFDDAKELRMRLMDEAKNADDVERIVAEFLKIR